MRKLLSYIRLGLTAGIAIIYYNLFYFRKFARHPEKYPYEVRYQTIRKLVRYVLKCFRVDYHVDGLEKFSDLQGKHMIIGNHHSDADPLIIFALSETPLTVISKKEAFSYPIIGNILKGIGAFSLDRENIMNQIGQIRDIVAHLKDPNKPNILVYVEGTRNKHPEDACLPFHAGTLKISKMAGVDIIPIASLGTSRILTRKSYLKKYPVFIKAFGPIDYTKYEKFDSNEEAANLRKQFDKEIDQLRTLDYKELSKQKMSNKRRLLETKLDVKRMS